MRQPLAALALLLPMALGACKGAPVADGACPVVAVVADLAQLPDLRRSGGKAIKAGMPLMGEIDDAVGRCRYTADSIENNVGFTLEASRQSAALAARLTLPYLVAVIDKDAKVIAKQNFETVFEMSQGQRAAAVTELLQVTIPRDAEAQAAPWRIMIGFQLMPEQLAYNRGEFGEPQPIAMPRGSVIERRE